MLLHRYMHAASYSGTADILLGLHNDTYQCTANRNKNMCIMFRDIVIHLY